MLDLVNDLLDVAKLEAGKFQVLRKSTQVSPMIDQRLQSYKSLAEEAGNDLTSKISKDCPQEILADENKIGQVLNNLLSNAIKFTHNGKIFISAFPLKKSEDMLAKVSSLGMIWPGLHGDVKFDKDQLIMAVTDSGVGIPEDQMNKLFNKFTQLEQGAVSEKKGTGLGLVISKGIIEAHGGKIGMFSETGKGTTFYFNLPLDGAEVAKT
jgi:two-component system sensor histidine kinase/response regulator